MNHAINTVSTKLIAQLKEAGEKVAKLLSFFLHCILITPNPIAIDVDFFLKQHALSLVISRSHDTYYDVSKNNPLLHALLRLKKVILSSVETHAQEDTIIQ